MKTLFSIKWIDAAAVRAIKTFAQVMCAMLTVSVADGVAFGTIDWKHIISVSAVSFVFSVITSVAGLPEVKEDGDEE